MFHIKVRDFRDWNPDVQLKKNENFLLNPLKNLWKLRLQNIYIYIYIYFRKILLKTVLT